MRVKIVYNIIRCMLAAVATAGLCAAMPCGATAAYGTPRPVCTDALEADTAVAGDEDLAWPENVKTRISGLLQDEMFETSMVGMVVYDLTADSVIFSHNGRQLMRPASTLKMMVAVAALDRLGDKHEYETKLYYKGKVEGNALDGDLYCKGGFDPMFDTDDLERFVDSGRGLGINTIRGDIYADLSMKDDDRLGEGWCWDDDNPVLTPLLLSGKDEFMETFKKRLHKAGIEVNGEIKEGRVDGHANRLCTVRRTIGDVLPRMMKESDNLYAETVFYQIAASSGSSATCTAKQGRKIVNRLIEKLGYKPSDYYIADGSGLSLYNYVSPELEVAFLRYAYRDGYIYARLSETMPIAGKDGTLDHRMRHGHAHGNVHAKTGTVTGVSALAGYCTAANGHELCFSIINMGQRKAATGRDFQDKVCEAMCRP